MRTFSLYKCQNRYDSSFLKFWGDTLRLAYPAPSCMPTTLNKDFEQPILTQATPLVQSAHPSKIGTLS